MTRRDTAKEKSLSLSRAHVGSHNLFSPVMMIT